MVHQCFFIDDAVTHQLISKLTCRCAAGDQETGNRKHTMTLSSVEVSERRASVSTKVVLELFGTI